MIHAWTIKNLFLRPPRIYPRYLIHKKSFPSTSVYKASIYEHKSGAISNNHRQLECSQVENMKRFIFVGIFGLSHWWLKTTGESIRCLAVLSETSYGNCDASQSVAYSRQGVSIYSCWSLIVMHARMHNSLCCHDTSHLLF